MSAIKSHLPFVECTAVMLADPLRRVTTDFAVLPSVAIDMIARTTFGEEPGINFDGVPDDGAIIFKSSDSMLNRCSRHAKVAGN